MEVLVVAAFAEQMAGGRRCRRECRLRRASCRAASGCVFHPVRSLPLKSCTQPSLSAVGVGLVTWASADRFGRRSGWIGIRNASRSRSMAPVTSPPSARTADDQQRSPLMTGFRGVSTRSALRRGCARSPSALACALQLRLAVGQHVGHFAGRLEAVVRVLGVQLRDDVAQPLRRFGDDLADRPRRVLGDALQDGQRGVRPGTAAGRSPSRRARCRG